MAYGMSLCSKLYLPQLDLTDSVRKSLAPDHAIFFRKVAQCRLCEQSSFRLIDSFRLTKFCEEYKWKGRPLKKR